MRILVTGAGGFVGGAIARAAVAAGHDTVGTVRPGRPAPPFRSVPLDLHDPDAVRSKLAELRPEIIVHAAWTGVTHHRCPAAGLLDIEATLRLLDAPGLRHFIGLGSQAEYGLRDTPDSTTPLPETHLPEPRTPYGAAKLAALTLSRQRAAASGVAFTWLRLFSAYGPGDAPGWLIPSTVAALRAGRAPATTAGEQRIDLLFVDDAARAVVAVIGAAATGVLNLGSGAPTTVRAVVDAIRDRVAPGRPPGPTLPYAPDQVWHLVADTARLRAATGWAPRIDLATGLDRTIAAAGRRAA